MPNSVTDAVRSKYPQYRDVPEDDLVRKLGEKYPAYLDRPDFKAEFDRVTGSTNAPAPPEPVAPKPTGPKDPDATLMGELYAEMHSVASDWGIQPAVEGNGFSAVDAANINRTAISLVRKEAENRIKAGTKGKVIRGTTAAITDLAHSVRDPATLALIGGAAIAGPATPLLTSSVVGATAGLAAKAVGTAAGSAAGGAPLDQMIRESLGAGVMVAATKGVAKATGGKEVGTTEHAQRHLHTHEEPRTVTTTPPPTVEPAVAPPPTLLLPDMLPGAEARSAFTRRFGAGNIPGIGKLLDPNAKASTPVHESLQVYAAERYGVGPAYASRLGALLKGLDDPFVITKEGDITNVGVREGASRKVSDVMEAYQADPSSVEVNAAQRASLERIASLEEQFKDLEQRYEIGRRIDDESGLFDDLDIPSADVAPHPYFPRVVTARPTPPPASRGAGAVGSKAFFEKSRMFETEAEGWSKGYKYEPSLEKRLVTRAERLYKRIADKRLAEDATLAGVTRSELNAQLKAEYAEELASGEMTPQRIQKIGDSLQSKGSVRQPAFQGRIFEAETARILNETLKSHSGTIREKIVRVNNAAKTMFLGFDVGNLFIQMLPTLYKDPVKWGTAARESMQALVSKDAWPAYAKDNALALEEMASLGSSTGKLPEFLAGMEKGELITKVPVVGPIAQAFGRQFTAGLDVAKTELWKAYREVTPKAEWPDLIRTIEAQLLSGRMESAGVSPNRALTERALFLAPSYYRGAIDLVGQLASRGVSGAVARRAIGSYLAVGPAVFYGVGSALAARGDMTQEELNERLNPADPAFMMWKVNVAGKPVNVGFGGIYKSVIKLAAGMVKTSVEHPENWMSLDPQENPMVRFLRGHSAPAPSVVMDQLSGRDYLGRDVDTRDIVPRIVPMAIQAILPHAGENTSMSEGVFSMLGLSAFTESTRNQYDAERERLSTSRHGKPYEELPMREQAALVKELNADPKFKRPPATSLQTERAIRAAKDREARLTSALTDENKALLTDLGLRVRGFENAIRVGSVDLPLTEKQRAAYETAIAIGYNKEIADHAQALRERAPDKRQEFLDRRLEKAREQARARLINPPK